MRTILAATIASLALMSSASSAAPNLAPNPSFELSVFEPEGLEGTLPQPLLPSGWAFEGLAGLFDHSPNDSAHGARSAAISAPASTNDHYCANEDVCTDNPINPAREALRPAYSLTPHWRTLEAIPVTAGDSYAFSVTTKLSIVTADEGATTRVRWVDDLGMTISETLGPQKLNTAGVELIDWTSIAKTVKAPAGATGAILMLGHTDDLWIGQVLFDEVSFAAA